MLKQITLAAALALAGAAASAASFNFTDGMFGTETSGNNGFVTVIEEAEGSHSLLPQRRTSWAAPGGWIL